MKRKHWTWIVAGALIFSCLTAGCLGDRASKRKVSDQSVTGTPTVTQEPTAAVTEVPGDSEKDMPFLPDEVSGGDQEAQKEVQKEMQKDQQKENDKQKADNSQKDDKKQEDQGSESRNLTPEELERFTAFVQNLENYGFLLSSYDEPADIDLDELFYNGAGVAVSGISKEEREAFASAAYQEFQTDKLKMKAAQVDGFLRRKTGLTLNQMNKKLSWIYLPEYDSYYTEVGGTNLILFTCEEGKIEGDKVYLTCTDSIYESHLTLEKDGDEYLFVANEFYVNGDKADHY